MTLLAGCIFAILSFAFAGGVVMVGDAATSDARAQLAADAASLAAVAESGPNGSGLPASAARRYAELNDARIVECICDPGATAMQVTVAIGDVTATARAEIDPDALAPADLFSATVRLQPMLQTAVTQLLFAGHGSIRVVSGYRSSDEQARLWADALATYGTAERADDWVAPPGGSMHERGLAVDLGGDLMLAQRLVASMGLPLVQPLDNEPWHFELAGARDHGGL